MNKTILLGRLTKVPEIRFSQANNNKVALLTLAVNRSYVKPGEERQADFINIVTYAKLADFVEKYLEVGTQILICGKIQTRNYEDKNGQRRYVTEVIAEEIYFADSPKKIKDNKPEEVENIKLSDDIILETDELPF